MAKLTDEEIRKIAEEAVRQLGGSASKETIEKVVREAADTMTVNTKPVDQHRPPASAPVAQNRIIVTAFGKNHTGILAGLTGILAEQQCDILDLSQKILQDFFTIMLLVDISESNLSLEEIKKSVVQRGEKLDLKVIVQHEDIFNAMHRI